MLDCARFQAEKCAGPNISAVFSQYDIDHCEGCSTWRCCWRRFSSEFSGFVPGEWRMLALPVSGIGRIEAQ